MYQLMFAVLVLAGTNAFMITRFRKVRKDHDALIEDYREQYLVDQKIVSSTRKEWELLKAENEALLANNKRLANIIKSGDIRRGIKIPRVVPSTKDTTETTDIFGIETS